MEYQGQQLKEKVYDTFIPFQKRARILTDKFLKFQDDYLTKEYGNLIKVMEKEKFADKLTEDDLKTKSKRFVSKTVKFIEQFPEYVSIIQSLNRKSQLTIVEFLEDKQNAIELLDLLFEPFEIDHNPKTKEEYNSYMKFMKECYDFFLIKSAEQINSVITTST